MNTMIMVWLLATFCAITPKGAEEEALNQLLNPEIVVECSKKGMTLEHYVEEDLSREESFLYASINSDLIRYDAEQKAVVLECLSFARNCFDRKVTRTKSRNAYSRLVIPVESEEDGKKVAEIITKLVSNQ